jgi:hypothetical protein
VLARLVALPGRVVTCRNGHTPGKAFYRFE